MKGAPAASSSSPQTPSPDSKTDPTQADAQKTDIDPATGLKKGPWTKKDLGKLVRERRLAKHLEGKVVTNDYNLNKVAKLHSVGVVNLNDIANSLKPIFLPGESLNVRIIKPGEDVRQGVGYLEDGTMVVIEGGREAIGKEVSVVVTSTLQTNAGRMIFARCEG